MATDNNTDFAQMKSRAEKEGKHVLWGYHPIGGFVDGVDVYVVPKSMDLVDLFAFAEEERMKYWRAWFAELDI